MKDEKKVKLLAPAGSKEALEAAVNHGADAVYLGGKRFGARRYADNFDDPGIRDAIRYAHLNDAEVYVTVNTLAERTEAGQMLSYMADLYSWGADAVIVQDLGAALLVRKHIPGLPVHASTQMTIHNRPQVEWADSLGFKAVVVSREVPLGAIGPMFQGLSPSPEIFVHGALCYSFSGQCLFSHFHQERSANKGMCAQPCRRAFKLVKDRNGERETVRSRGQYPLCMRDLCTVEMLDRLVDSPVRVLKIEGRMKGEQYVKATTSIYRKYLDLALSGRFESVDKLDLDLLWLAYNREFTRGYLFDSRFGQVKSPYRPDNRGMLLGTITDLDPRKETMKVRTVTDIMPNNRDVIKVVSDTDYRSKNLNLHVKQASRDPAGNLVLNSHREADRGDRVYLATHDMNPYLLAVQRGVEVDVAVVLRKGGPVLMSASGKGFSAEASGTQEVTEARTSPMDADSVVKQVMKTAPYQVRVGKVRVDMDPGVFVTISELNNVRRTLYEKTENSWLAHAYPLPRKVRVDADRALAGRRVRAEPGPAKLSVITNDPGDIGWLRDKKADCIYLDRFYGLSDARNLEAALGLVQEYGGPDLFIKTPRITLPWELRAWEALLKKLATGAEFGGFRAGNWGAFRTIRSVFPDAEVHAGVSFNVTNFVSSDELLRDFGRVTLSQELDARGMADLARDSSRPSGLDVLAGGRHAIMVTRDCLLGSSFDKATTGPNGFTDKRCRRSCAQGDWYLKDYKKRHYPLWMDPDCFGHLYNHTVLDTDLGTLKRAGLGSFIVDLRGFPSSGRKQALADFRERLWTGGKPLKKTPEGEGSRDGRGGPERQGRKGSSSSQPGGGDKRRGGRRDRRGGRRR